MVRLQPEGALARDRTLLCRWHDGGRGHFIAHTAIIEAHFATFRVDDVRNDSRIIPPIKISGKNTFLEQQRLFGEERLLEEHVIRLCLEAEHSFRLRVWERGDDRKLAKKSLHRGQEILPRRRGKMRDERLKAGLETWEQRDALLSLLA